MSLAPGLTVKTAAVFGGMNAWQAFSVGLGIATVLALAALFVLYLRYRNRRLTFHELHIIMNGGVFQGSSEELVFKAKMGHEIDVSRFIPEKEGYRFNGYNAYKKFISSSITEQGIRKIGMTTEELDGVDKDVIIMPDYDLYLVAKYSPLPGTAAQGLAEDMYYPDFMVFDDLVADLKHLNSDKESYPAKINFRRSEKAPGYVFVFKKDALVAMLKKDRYVSKVYLRTSKPLDDKLLSPFYQKEDINDAMNWYSFVVIYNTKPARFLRSFRESYDDIDAKTPTSQIELDLIVGSLSSFADPVVDRAIYLTEKFEQDSCLPEPPDYVLKRQLPPGFSVNYSIKAEKTDSGFSKEEIIRNAILRQENDKSAAEGKTSVAQAAPNGSEGRESRETITGVETESDGSRNGSQVIVVVNKYEGK